MQPTQETSKTQAPGEVGLYYSPTSDTYIGCIDPAQADAVKERGYSMVKAGHEAAMWTEAQIEKARAKQAAVKTEEPNGDVEPPKTEEV